MGSCGKDWREFRVEEETAAEYVKSRLPEALKQHLQDYEKDKENSVLSYQTILEQQILSIDREMLEKLTVSYDEAVVNPRATDKQQRNRQKPLSAHTDIYCLPGSSQVLGLSCGEGQSSVGFIKKEIAQITFLLRITDVFP
ncbi:protein phosphatase 1L-like protein [Cricetulus griseus]|nr:protein phosphatase 1L-like protein [Cricetulus griseus]